MQIKRFEAKNMTTALRMIKGELGPEAVILSAKSIRKGKGFFGSMKYAGVEVTAAVDMREAKTKISGSAPAKASNPKLLNRQTLLGDPIAGQDFGYSSAYLKYGQPYAKKHPHQNKLTSSNHRLLSSLYQQILAQGVDRGIASELIDEIKRIPASQDILTPGDLNHHLGTILEEMGIRADKNSFAEGRPNIVALIGTTGVGKTTTVAKLAAVQSSRCAQKVAVITIDNYGIAANEQLKAYTRIIDIPLETAVNPIELKQAINNYQQKDLILIDTPGLNPTDPVQIRELKSFFKKLPDLQIHLVLSATTKEKDLIKITEKFKEVGVQRLLFTKLDESGTFGNILNELIRTQIPLSFLSCGRMVPDDIEAGSIQKLVDLIFQIKKLESKPSTEPSILQGNGSPSIQKPAAKRRYFVANKNSDIYHENDCKWSDKIKTEHIIRFDSYHEAEAQNFMPCRSCNPDRLIGTADQDSKTATQKYSSYQ